MLNPHRTQMYYMAGSQLIQRVILEHRTTFRKRIWTQRNLGERNLRIAGLLFLMRETSTQKKKRMNYQFQNGYLIKSGIIDYQFGQQKFVYFYLQGVLIRES